MTPNRLLSAYGLRQRLYAWLVGVWSRGYEPLVFSRKRSLLEDLRGVVVEIGPGTGPNLAFYHQDVVWIGVEPNGYMNPYLQRQAQQVGRSIDVRAGSAEQLPVADESADAVVSTMVLCSVDDQEQSLQEVMRVLKPGGRYVFMEHVAAEPGSRLLFVQQIINPGWRLVADGCHVNRRTGEAIEAAGFREVHLQRFSREPGICESAYCRLCGEVDRA